MATCCQRWPVGCHLWPPSPRGCSRYGPLSLHNSATQCHHIWCIDNTLGEWQLIIFYIMSLLSSCFIFVS